MNIKDIIRAPKSEPDLGAWRSGHISKNAFPLSKLKSKAYKFGPEYSWRVVTFTASGLNCRVLLLLNEGKKIFRASLAVEMPSDCVVLCHHEYHDSEPGWHCHLTFDEIQKVIPGINRSQTSRWPSANTVHSRQEFEVNKKNALTFAAAVYKFGGQGELI